MIVESMLNVMNDLADNELQGTRTCFALGQIHHTFGYFLCFCRPNLTKARPTTPNIQLSLSD
jgi:hypothetical protein